VNTCGVECVAIAGERVASGSCGGTVRVWTSYMNKSIVLHGHVSAVKKIMFCKLHEHVLISCGDCLTDHTICVWDTRTAALLYEPIQLFWCKCGKKKFIMELLQTVH
jgi:WD40 repeat protein